MIGFIALIFFCALIMGLFKPAWVLPGVKNHQKIKAFCLYAFAFALTVGLLSLGRLSASSDPKTPASLVDADASAALVGTEAITKAFTECLRTQARKGKYAYSSSDDGESAVLLLGECPSEWKAYSEDCMKAGDNEGSCATKSTILAQAAVKLLQE